MYSRLADPCCEIPFYVHRPYCDRYDYHARTLNIKDTRTLFRLVFHVYYLHPLLLVGKKSRKKLSLQHWMPKELWHLQGSLRLLPMPLRQQTWYWLFPYNDRLKPENWKMRTTETHAKGVSTSSDDKGPISEPMITYPWVVIASLSIMRIYFFDARFTWTHLCATVILATGVGSTITTDVSRFLEHCAFSKGEWPLFRSDESSLLLLILDMLTLRGMRLQSSR